MTDYYILPFADPRASLEIVGGKGASLARMAAAGLPVPDGFHVTTAAYSRFLAANDLEAEILLALDAVDRNRPQTLDAASRAITAKFLSAEIPGDIANAVVHAYASLPGVSPPVAVRSSATAEDLPEASFAGQQETYLNISGAEALLEATRKCWASLWTARAIGYRARQGISTEGVALAVVVQILVPSEAAGILFTANPMNGRRDQLVISASWGLGESIVGGQVSPDNLVLEKSTGKVVHRETAEKLIQTVRVSGGTSAQPVPENLQRIPVLSDSQAAELARLGVKIERLFDLPLDIEWALADGEFAIVQARPITALRAPDPLEPIDWPMPNPKGHYVRASIVDLMPDPLSPLFATLGLRAINKGISAMSQEFLNMPQGYSLNVMTTINGYAYQDAGFSARQWFVLLTRMLPAIPRMLRKGVSYWKEIVHPNYLESISHWNQNNIERLTPGELWRGINELAGAFGYHLGALMASTMGPTSGSEGLFSWVYENFVKRETDPPAPTFLMGLENAPLRAEKSLFDMASWCQEQELLCAYLKNRPTNQLSEMLSRKVEPTGIDPDLWEDWQRRFQDHLDTYGYSIYDLDFAKPLPADEPAPILEMLKLFIAGKGKSPYERQQEFTQRREEAERIARSRLRGIRSWAFEKALKWAQTQAPLREDGIAEIGRAYPLLRRMLAELGHRLAMVGGLDDGGDIYWLEQEEVESLVQSLKDGKNLQDMAAVVADRKSLWEARQHATPPPQLPPGKKYMGFDLEGILAGGEGEAEEQTITGVAASPGQVTAPARVLHGPEEFSQLQPGEVLVAGITTPAWTPLFALAAGVVTDIGGPLSHGSIVAREYGIPAVLGTGVATRRIHSGQSIHVDGSAGTVKMLNGAS